MKIVRNVLPCLEDTFLNSISILFQGNFDGFLNNNLEESEA